MALVCLPEISMRAVTRVPSPDDLVDAVENLCRRHALQRPCLLGHSFGSFLVARACQRSKVAAVVMIDPVSSCLMLPAVVTRVMYQLDDRWRELIGRESAGMEAVDPEAKRALGLARGRSGGIFDRRVSIRDKAELVTRYLFTLVRDWFVVKELSATVALCRQFWWFQVCALWTCRRRRHGASVLRRHPGRGEDQEARTAQEAAEVLWWRVSARRDPGAAGLRGEKATTGVHPESRRQLNLDGNWGVFGTGPLDGEDL